MAEMFILGVILIGIGMIYLINRRIKTKGALFTGQTTPKLTSVNNPLRISQPTIGFLNLNGVHGSSLAEKDKASLEHLFHASYLSNTTIPKCHVLFIYCSIDSNGNIDGAKLKIRDIVKEAGAYIAVVATENIGDHYIKAIKSKNNCGANIVLVIERNGDNFLTFFHQLFQAMLQGTSMLVKWVELAPQIPAQHHSNCPESILIAEAGHVIFDGHS
jgi:hypothetical protein